MRYSEIKTMDELESAQRNVRERLNRRKRAMREPLLAAREGFHPFQYAVLRPEEPFGFPSSGEAAACCRAAAQAQDIQMTVNHIH